MLSLQKNQVNQKSLPLATASNYLFVFSRSNKSYFVIPTVTSSNSRAVGFTIDTTTNDFENGSIVLLSGQYNLEVYSQASVTNLDPSLSSEKIYSCRTFVDMDSTVIEFNPVVTKLKEFNPI